MGFILFHNLKSFIYNRPPLVIFTLCLAAFTITFFSYAAYVNFSDKIRNPDNADWNAIAVNLSKLQFCIQLLSRETSNAALQKPPMAANMTSFSIAFEAPKDVKFHNYTTIMGIINPPDLGLKAPVGNGSIEAILSLMVIHDATFLCATFTGPKHIFPTLPETTFAKCHTPEIDTEVGAFQVLPKPEPHHPRSKCLGIGIQSVRVHGNPDWILYLSETDRSIMSVHLLATSYFLLATIASLLIFAGIRGGGKRAKQFL